MPNKDITLPKENLVLYHANCLDGYGAAAVAYSYLQDSANYVPMQHGDVIPDVTGKHVYILDFSCNREVLLELKEKAAFLVVLDHHKTAKDDLEDLDFCIFDMEKSGCRLAYEWFYKFSCTTIPEWVLLIEDRDLWRFHYPDTKPFNAGLFSEFAQLPFDEFLHRTPDSFIKKGKIILSLQEAQITAALKRKHKVWLQNGVDYIGCGVNATENISELGNKLAAESKTFGCVYSFNGTTNLWNVSLRAYGDFDVSEIAKTFGGGGHKAAAAFTTKDINWILGSSFLTKQE